ncbi:hypothetical protein E2562_012812 [Oryza meyeriana var. granulata]|uniref:Reverse transcriptase domain-containing protein n=1 Tax=Oryza meyeriana var. granulata TaxID=110450 RepID=A0A6G1DIF1_9ORYZ|nr:hypothetical protein E2562_012812 [Oryza meyeriana var. granulata]
MARRFHQTHTPILLLKLDITKAFDTVRWDYLLDLMHKRGFLPRWRNWITNILRSSSTRILLNGNPGEPIKHGRGLRQGNHLSPLLFILAIDPLNQILDKATDKGYLTALNGRTARPRTSLYANDAAIFIRPTTQDMRNLARILSLFGEVTGLRTNMEKSQEAPICCTNLDLGAILTNFLASITGFPMKYLSLCWSSPS